MMRRLRNAWRRWRSWSLPTKIGIVGTVASVLSVALYFWDLKPFLERRLSPPLVVPNVVVRISNSEKSDVSLSYRGEFVLWFPSAMAPGVPRVGGAYEVIASDAGLVKDGVVPVRGGGATRIVVKLMDQERMAGFLKRGDASLSLLLRRPDGSLFFSEDLPFTEDAIKELYTRADLAKEH